jgi:flavorubredoxin
MAELIAEGCLEVGGVQVEMVALPEADMDVIAQADAFAVGSPDYFSYVAGHVKTWFDEALAWKNQIGGKPYVAFGSHGGGARVLESAEHLCQAIGMHQVRAGMMCMGAPGVGEEPALRALGKALGEAAAASR